MPYPANAYLPAARHQNAALAILKQVLPLILNGLLRTDTHWPDFSINRVTGDSDKRLLSVAALVNGTTITCELRLDLTLIRNPEYDIFSRRHNGHA
jgi:hypothetical protein